MVFMKKFLLCFSIICLCVFHGSAQIERIMWTRGAIGVGGTYIYTMLPDGTDITSLSGANVSDHSPRISPDGSKIVFDRNGDDIYSMNADGTNVINLTKSVPNVYMGYPSWSPDGSKIVYIYYQIITSSIPYYFTDNSIWVMNADGSNQTRLTADGPSAPSWSSTNKIAFVTNYNGYSHIHTMDPDGSNTQRLTNGTANHGAPRWSPDGSKISFASERNREVGMYIMNADGSGEVRLVSKDTAFEWDWGPAAWSADGTRLAFSSKVNSGGPAPDIYTINIDGTNLTRVNPVDDPFNHNFDSSPEWITIAIPPVALAGTTPAVTSATALVNGIVSANGAATTVSFQYSTDPSLATGVIEVAASPGTLGAFNNNNVTASASLVNLDPGTTYYYRLKGVNSKGTALGLSNLSLQL
jgi:Tol biopolymer transport system component